MESSEYKFEVIDLTMFAKLLVTKSLKTAVKAYAQSLHPALGVNGVEIRIESNKGLTTQRAQ